MEKQNCKVPNVEGHGINRLVSSMFFLFWYLKYVNILAWFVLIIEEKHHVCIFPVIESY